MKRENPLFIGGIDQSHLLFSIGNLILFLLMLVGIIFLTGCDLDVDLDREEEAEPPVIVVLESERSVLKPREAVTITAKVPCHKDPDLLYEYDWSTTDKGDIKNNGVRNSNDGTKTITVTATYIAPEDPGTYIISLKVCTRYAVVEKAISVEVMDYSIEFSPRTYWKADDGEQSLTYWFDIEAIRRSPILLQYKIHQDPWQPAATLIVNIGKESLRPENIEKAPVTTPASISKEIDITKYIKQTTQYELRFTLKTVKPIMDNTWFLKNIKIAGVEGYFLK